MTTLTVDETERKKQWLLNAITNPNSYIQYSLSLEEQGLKHREIKLLGILKSILKLESWDYVGYADDYLCQFLQCTSTTANKSLNKLEKAGLILIQNKGSKNRKIFLGEQKAIVEKQQAEAQASNQTQAIQDLTKEIQELRKQLEATQKENNKLKRALKKADQNSVYMQVEPTEPVFYLQSKGYLTAEDLQDGIKVARLNKAITDLKLNNHTVKQRMNYILSFIKDVSTIQDRIGYMVTALQNNDDYLKKQSENEIQKLLERYEVLDDESQDIETVIPSPTESNSLIASNYDTFKAFLNTKSEDEIQDRESPEAKETDKTDYFEQYFSQDPRFKKE